MAGTTSQKVVIPVEFKDANKSAGRMIEQIENAMKNLKVGSSVEKSVGKQYSSLTREFSKIQEIMNKGLIDGSDTTKLVTAFSKVHLLVNNISQDLKDASIGSIALSSEDLKSLQKANDKVAELSKKIQNLKNTKVSDAFVVKKDQNILKNADVKLGKNVLQEYDILKKSLAAAEQEAEKLKQELEELKNSETELLQSRNSLESNAENALLGIGSISTTSIGKNGKEIKRNYTSIASEIQKSLKSVIDSGQQDWVLEALGFDQASINKLNIEDKAKVIKEKFLEELSKAETAEDRKNFINDFLNKSIYSIDNQKNEIDKKLIAIDAVRNGKDTVDLSDLKEQIEAYKKALPLLERVQTELNKQINEIQGEASDTSTDTLVGAQKQLQQLINTFKQLYLQVNGSLDGLEGLLNGAQSSVNKSQNAQAEAENFKKSLTDAVNRWFTLRDVINIVKNGVRQAVNDIQGLDKAMANIAVVTDMSIEDLWGKINEYMSIAKQYGVTTQGVYEVSQLYYQQGLNTAEVTELTAETLKLARVANMDYAASADAMTVALRGFKMEMSEAATVTDVYSKVAAITASDQQELAVAMSKTASSAASVGSSFENTTAMLAVMVETTRESAQNLGSALKSIISRYGEMKVGVTVDSEGEALDYNKVDTALKSIGISLKDAQGQFRDFDDVIFELSAKWDGLDKNTQRYIATIMAGNRQQSRFIALVDNWERLDEVSKAAADSQDAGLLQYAKTMDSLETKINNIKTSFQQFYMNIFNGPVIGKFLEFINSVIEGFNKLGNWQSILNVGSMLITVKTLATFFVNTFANSFGGIVSQFRLAMQEIVAAASNGGDDAGETFSNSVRSGLAKGKTKQSWITTKPGKTTSLIASGVGLAASFAGSAISANNVRAGSIVSGIGNIASGASMGAAFGPWGAAIGGLIGGLASLPAVLESWDPAKVLQEKLDKATEAFEQANIERAQKKEEARNLASTLENLKKLQLARYESEEAEKAFIDASNAAFEQFPQLTATFDEAGNAIVDVINNSTEAEWLLINARKEAAKATQNAAGAELHKNKTELEQAKQNYKNYKNNVRTVVQGDNSSEQLWVEEWFLTQAVGKAGNLEKRKSKFKKDFGIDFDTIISNFNISSSQNSEENLIALGEFLTQAINNPNTLPEYQDKYQEILTSLNEELIDAEVIKKGQTYTDIAAREAELLQKITEGQGAETSSLYANIFSSTDLLLTNKDPLEKASFRKLEEGYEIFNENILSGIYDKISKIDYWDEENKTFTQEAQNIINTAFDEAYNSYNQFAENLGFQLDDFNMVVENAKKGNYNLSELKDRFDDFGDLEEGSVLNSFYTQYKELFEASVGRIDKYFNDTNNPNNYSDIWKDFQGDNSIFNIISLTYHDEVFSFISDINKKIEKGIISKTQATQFASEYANLFTNLNENLDPSIAKQAEVLITQASASGSIFTPSGQQELQTALEKLGISTDQLDVTDLPDYAVNLVTEWSLLEDKLTSNLTSATEAMSKAASGLELEDVTKMINTYKVSWDDFEFIDGKWVLNNFEAIEKYYNDEAEKLKSQLDKEEEKIKEVFKGFDADTLTNFATYDGDINGLTQQGALFVQYARQYWDEAHYQEWIKQGGKEGDLDAYWTDYFAAMGDSIDEATKKAFEYYQKENEKKAEEATSLANLKSERDKSLEKAGTSIDKIEVDELITSKGLKGYSAEELNKIVSVYGEGVKRTLDEVTGTYTLDQEWIAGNTSLGKKTAAKTKDDAAKARDKFFELYLKSIKGTLTEQEKLDFTDLNNEQVQNFHNWLEDHAGEVLGEYQEYLMYAITQYGADSKELKAAAKEAYSGMFDKAFGSDLDSFDITQEIIDSAGQYSEDVLVNAFASLDPNGEIYSDAQIAGWFKVDELTGKLILAEGAVLEGVNDWLVNAINKSELQKQVNDEIKKDNLDRTLSKDYADLYTNAADVSLEQLKNFYESVFGENTFGEVIGKAQTAIEEGPKKIQEFLTIILGKARADGIKIDDTEIQNIVTDYTISIFSTISSYISSLINGTLSNTDFTELEKQLGLESDFKEKYVTQTIDGLKINAEGLVSIIDDYSRKLGSTYQAAKQLATMFSESDTVLATYEGIVQEIEKLESLNGALTTEQQEQLKILRLIKAEYSQMADQRMFDFMNVDVFDGNIDNFKNLTSSIGQAVQELDAAFQKDGKIDVSSFMQIMNWMEDFGGVTSIGTNAEGVAVSLENFRNAMIATMDLSGNLDFSKLEGITVGFDDFAEGLDKSFQTIAKEQAEYWNNYAKFLEGLAKLEELQEDTELKAPPVAFAADGKNLNKAAAEYLDKIFETLGVSLEQRKDYLKLNLDIDTSDGWDQKEWDTFVQFVEAAKNGDLDAIHGVSITDDNLLNLQADQTEAQKQIQGELENTKASLDDTTQSVTELNREISALTDKPKEIVFTVNKEEVEKLKTEVYNLDPAEITFVPNMSQVFDAIEEIEQTPVTLNGNILLPENLEVSTTAATQSNFNNTENATSSWVRIVTDLQNELDEVKKSREEQTTKIENLTGIIETLSTTIEKQKTDIDALKKDKEKLQSEKDSQQAKIDDLTKQNDSLQTLYSTETALRQETQELLDISDKELQLANKRIEHLNVEIAGKELLLSRMQTILNESQEILAQTQKDLAEAQANNRDKILTATSNSFQKGSEGNGEELSEDQAYEKALELQQKVISYVESLMQAGVTNIDDNIFGSIQKIIKDSGSNLDAKDYLKAIFDPTTGYAFLDGGLTLSPETIDYFNRFFTITGQGDTESSATPEGAFEAGTQAGGEYNAGFEETVTETPPSAPVEADTTQAQKTVEALVENINSSFATLEIETRFRVGSDGIVTSNKGGQFTAEQLAEIWTNIYNGNAEYAGNVSGLALYNGANLANKTLVGELGPELAVYDNMYHLLGQHGAEFVNLPDDAIVFNHRQTKGIIRGQAGYRGTALVNGNVSGPAYAGGSIAAAAKQARQIANMWQGLLDRSVKELVEGGGGGGGGENSIKAHIEDLEEWYNLLRQIENLEQKISNIQAERANIDDGHEYLRSLREEQALLEKQVTTQEILLNYQQKQLKLQADQINQNKIWSQFLIVGEDGLLQYKKGNEANGGKGALSVLQKLNEMSGEEQLAYIEKLGYSYTTTDGEELEKEELIAKFFEELQAQIDAYDELYDTVNETEETLESLETSISDIDKEILENQMTLETAVYEALVSMREKEIEQLEEQVDLIKEANEAYIDGIEKAIQAERDMYEKNEAVSDREQLQRRLALLKMSNGSASEIADLEAQLDETLKNEYFSRQEESLDAIRDASDKQIERLDNQIRIMEENLAYQKENGILWQKVYDVMANDEASILNFISGNNTAFIEKSVLEQKQMLNEWAKQIGIYKEDQANKYNTEKGYSIWDKDYSGNKTLSGLTKDQRTKVSDEFASAYAKHIGEGMTEEEATEAAWNDVQRTISNFKSENEKSKEDSKKDGSTNKDTKKESKSFTVKISAANEGGSPKIRMGNSAEWTSMKARSGNIITIIHAPKDGYKAAYSTVNGTNIGLSTSVAVSGSTTIKVYYTTRNNSRSGKAPGYSSGGMVDFTGPAMLHGSPSKPEAVLNAKQTDAFMELVENYRRLAGFNNPLLSFVQSHKDALSSKINNTNNCGNTVTVAPGAVQIAVAQLNDKYDVDELANDVMNRMVVIANKSTNRGVNRR